MRVPGLAGRRVLLNSNLSVLLCVGLADTNYIRSHKRLGSYDEVDFEMLRDIVRGASGLVVSPNVASETSNLTRQINSPAREHIAGVLRDLVEQAYEVYVESRSAARDSTYLRLGLTDAGLLHLLNVQDKLVLVTADHDLHIAAAVRRLAVVNFSHLRDQRPDFR